MHSLEKDKLSHVGEKEEKDHALPEYTMLDWVLEILEKFLPK